MKSCIEDFKADNKWPDYLDYCNQMYFVVLPSFWNSKHGTILRSLKEYGVGVMVLGSSGYLQVKQRAATRKMLRKHKMHILTRIAWRCGEYSARTTKPVRVYTKDSMGVT